MVRNRFWLGRCCFLLLVLSAGAALYFLLPDQPLWTLDVDEQVGGFAGDGGRFFTYVAGRDYQGPVRLRDRRSGAEVESFFADGAELKRPEVSGDRRYLAAVVEPNEIRVIDFQERRAISLRAEDVNGEYQLHFSPQSDMLQVRAAHAKLPDRNFVFELPGGKRFGNPDELLHVRFSPTGRHLVYVNKDGLHLWDRLANKEAGLDLGDDERIQFSPDGRRLVTYEDLAEKEPFRLVLWDLETHRRVAALPVEQPLQTRWAAAAFSPDSRWLGTWHDYPDSGHVLETWDADTGKRLGRYVRRVARCSVVVAPDSFGVLLNEWGPMGGEPARVTLTMLEMPAAKVRWQRKFEPKKAHVQWMMAQGIQPDNPDDVRFSPDSNVVIAYSSLHAEWDYLDAHTGATAKTVHLCDAGAKGLFFPPLPVASPDGRWLLASTRLLDPPSIWDSKWLDWARRWLPERPRHHSLTALYDAATGVEMRRLKIEGSSYSHLAPNGQIVLTDTVRADGETSTRRLQAWPVPAQRPWLQIVGIPLLGAAALLALRWAWRRWRKRALTP